ncbi:hypothetical protein LCGC14_1962150 [marine sediment metagenome]|uniref:Uncharacterized protein n=1 Tax=marine sediment metagenome TaxID=412755 RepID=A0A0F9G2K3_9ZZZZ
MENKTIIHCTNITGNASDLCTIVDTDTDTWLLNYTDYYTKSQVDNNFTLYLLLTDQRYNETNLLNSINTTANIKSLSFYDKSEVDNNLSLYLLLTDQRFNETTLLNSINTTANIQSLGFYTKTEVDNNFSLYYLKTEVDALNNTMGTYVNTQDVIYNDSAAAYTDSKLITTFFNASAILAVTGTPQGAIADLQSYNETSYNLSEASSDMELRVNFTSITDFNQLIVRYKSASTESHTMVIQMWNYNSSDWESYRTVGNTENEYNIFTMSVYDADEHISGGIVQLRFYSNNAGGSTHKHQFDWVAISEGPATPSSDETDPHAIHSDAMVSFTANWDQGAFNFTNTDSWWEGKVNASEVQNNNWIEDSELPLENRTVSYCGNITGATSDLCTITDTNDSSALNDLNTTLGIQLLVNNSLNKTDYWDNYNTANATQIENSGGVLNILVSWLEGLFISDTDEGDLNVNSSDHWDNFDTESELTHDNLISGTIADHDTGATGSELDTLTDNSMADVLHRHSELSASDGTPDGVFTVDATGNVRFYDSGNDPTLNIGDSGSGGNFGFLRWVSATDTLNLGTTIGGTFNDQITLLESGNVGIGTTSPTHALNVVGDVNITGTTYFGNITCFNQVCTWYTNATDSCMYWPSGGRDCGA